MAKKVGAQTKILEYLIEHIGEDIPREKLTEIAAPTLDWPRGVRNLRQSGWEIETTPQGYKLNSTEKKEKKGRTNIPNNIRYAILQRDNSTCKRCGNTIEDGIKLEVDHKLPVDWGGDNDLDNLWTLCNICNGGKKHLFSDLDNDVMREVMRVEKGSQKLRVLFELSPNVILEVHVLEAISKIRDWTRTIRQIRKTYGLNIQWVPKTADHPTGYYINKID